jgi:hypothetical protein
LVGCSGIPGRLPVYPVSGTVLVNDQPAAGAIVFFHPAADPANPRGLRPIATTGDDGTFRLTSYLRNDGAPIGEYVVTVTWPAPRAAGPEDEGTPSGDRLKGAYATPAVSKLRATIVAGKNQLEPFRLR